MQKKLFVMSGLLVTLCIASKEQAAPHAAHFSYDTQVINIPWLHLEANAAAIRKDALAFVLGQLQDSCNAQNISCGLCGVVKNMQDELQKTTLEAQLQDPRVIQKGEAIYTDVESLIPLIISLMVARESTEAQMIAGDLITHTIKKHLPDVVLSENIHELCKDNKNLSEEQYKHSIYSIMYAVNKYALLGTSFFKTASDEINKAQTK